MYKRALTLVAVATIAVTGLAGCSSARDSSGKITKPTTLKWGDLQAGDCVAGTASEDSIEKLPVVPCDQTHKAQVFGVATLSGFAYPTDDEVQAQVLDQCVPTFKTFFGGSYYAAVDYKLTWIQPDKSSWTSNTRTVKCMTRKQDDGDISADLKGTMTGLANVVSNPEVGACTGDVANAQWNDDGVEIVDCAKPHFYEIYAAEPMTTIKPASDNDIKTEVTTFCKAQFESFVGLSFDSSTLDVRSNHPSMSSWDATSKHDIQCMVGSDAGGITDTLKGAKK
jgi:hypothetical protein